MRKICMCLSETPLLRKVYATNGQFEWDRMWKDIEMMSALLVMGVL
jgi:hypothetical protein